MADIKTILTAALVIGGATYFIGQYQGAEATNIEHGYKAYLAPQTLIAADAEYLACRKYNQCEGKGIELLLQGLHEKKNRAVRQ